jgi:hypothetical protein
VELTADAAFYESLGDRGALICAHLRAQRGHANGVRLFFALCARACADTTPARCGDFLCRPRGRAQRVRSSCARAAAARARPRRCTRCERRAPPPPPPPPPLCRVAGADVSPSARLRCRTRGTRRSCRRSCAGSTPAATRAVRTQNTHMRTHANPARKHSQAADDGRLCPCHVTASSGAATLRFPAGWPKEDRARAHGAAERAGLTSRSVGLGDGRRITILSPAAADAGARAAFLRVCACCMHADVAACALRACSG